MILLDEESKRENFQEVSLTAQELTFRYKEKKRGDKKKRKRSRTLIEVRIEREWKFVATL